MLHVWREFINYLVITTRSCVEIELIRCVDYFFLHREHIRPEFKLAAEGTQEVFESELSLADWECGFSAIFDILVTVMQKHLNKFGGQKFFHLCGISFADKENMFLIKFANGLLGHLLGEESRLINELESGIDRFKLGISLEWDVFAGI